MANIAAQITQGGNAISAQASAVSGLPPSTNVSAQIELLPTAAPSWIVPPRHEKVLTPIQPQLLKTGLEAYNHQTQFNYSFNGDANGVCYYAGTGYGRYPFWVNPHTTGRVVVTFSSNTGFEVQTTNRQGGANSFTANTANSWIALDLGEGRTLSPNYYSLQHDNQSQYYLRNWKIQGSNNAASNSVSALAAATWTDLDTRTSDTTINAPEAWVSKPISGVTTGYRWLRVMQTGTNSSGNTNLLLGEFEFYGTFT